MSFPVTPSDGTIYTTALGSRYKYYAADGKWVKEGLIPLEGMGATGMVSMVIDGGGAPISTGPKGDVTLPYRMRLNSWQVLTKETGSISIGIWKSTYTDYPPTMTGAIHIGSTGPYVGNGIKNQGTTTNWITPTGAVGDILRINVDSATTVTQASVSLNFFKY